MIVHPPETLWIPAQQPSVAIFSSFRKFWDRVATAHSIFVANGIYVSTPPSGPPIDPSAKYVRFEGDDPKLADYEIQKLVFAKALASTAIYVICPDGYMGNTVSYEVGLTSGAAAPLYFSELPEEPLLHRPASGRIVDPQQLSRMILEGTVTPIDPTP